MPETPLTREAALQDTISLLGLAIRRSRTSKVPDLPAESVGGAYRRTDREGSVVWEERRREVAKW